MTDGSMRKAMKHRLRIATFENLELSLENLRHLIAN